jgi:hypothetical protein
MNQNIFFTFAPRNIKQFALFNVVSTTDNNQHCGKDVQDNHGQKKLDTLF